MLKSFVPELRSRPKPANQAPPRRQMVGATATVSTLATVVGQPKTPGSSRSSQQPRSVCSRTAAWGQPVLSGCRHFVPLSSGSWTLSVPRAGCGRSKGPGTHPRRRGRGASGAACPACPRWTRSAPSPPRRCRLRRPSPRRHRRRTPSRRRPAPAARPRRPPGWPPAAGRDGWVRGGSPSPRVEGGAPLFRPPPLTCRLEASL